MPDRTPRSMAAGQAAAALRRGGGLPSAPTKVMKVSMLNRRTFLAASGAAVAGTAGGRPSQAAEPVIARLTLAPAKLELLPGHPAADGLELTEAGSAVRLARDAPALLALRNTLDEPASLRWDGLRGWGALDAPDTQKLAALAPGQGLTVPVRPPDSGTTLLRGAPSAAHLAGRGLESVVLVDEVTPPTVDRDMAVLLADRLFAADGTPRFGSTPPADAATAIVTVNGRPAPWNVEVPPGARLRLRLVNGSVRRLMLVGCDGARPAIVAIDGQPSEMFTPRQNTVPIGPGARYDLMLDMPATGAEVRLALRPSERLGAALESERLLVRLQATGAARPTRSPIAPLPPNPALPAAIALEAAKRVELVIAGEPGTPSTAPHGWSVNGIAGDKAVAPALTVRRGAAVTLGFVNTTPVLVPLRIAGHAMRLLHARDDGWDPYWRDTLLLPPGSRTHVAFVADTPGRWAIDSGYDDLTMAGLSCWFAVSPG